MKITNKKTNILTSVETESVLSAVPAEEAIFDAAIEPEISINEAAGRKRFWVRILTYLAIPLFAGLFVAFVYFKGGDSILKLVAPAVSMLFFALVTIRLIPLIVMNDEPSMLYPVGERSRKRLHPYVRIVLFSLLAQIVILLLVYVLHSVINGFDILLPEGYSKLFALPRSVIFGENTRSIVSSLGLISFVLPQHVERMTSELSVYIPTLAVNALAVAAASVCLYELVICDHSKRRAKFSVLLLHIMPSVLLLMQPFGGTALFFAFALLSLLLARKGRILGAGIAAFAASLFNVFAVLLVVPIALEWRIHSSIAGARAERDKGYQVKPLPAVFGVVIALLPAAAAAVLKALGFAGLSAFEGEVVFHFDPIGRLLSEWNGGALSRPVIVVILAALVFAALLILFGVRFTRSSHTAFALVFTVAAGILRIDLALYAVFALPILASLIGEKCAFKASRTIVGLTAFALLVLFIIFFYIKRTV